MENHGKLILEDTFGFFHSWYGSLKNGIITHYPNNPAEKYNNLHEERNIAIDI
jgi:hypothetical protein